MYNNSIYIQIDNMDVLTVFIIFKNITKETSEKLKFLAYH